MYQAVKLNSGASSLAGVKPMTQTVGLNEEQVNGLVGK